DRAGIVATLTAVIDRHDMLRARLRRHAGAEWIVETSEPGAVDVDALLDRVEFDAAVDDAALHEIATAALDSALDRLAPDAAVVDGPDPLLTSRPLDPAVDVQGVLARHRVEVSAETTRALLTTVPELFHGGVNDALVTALVLAAATWRAERAERADSMLIRLE